MWVNICSFTTGDTKKSQFSKLMLTYNKVLTCFNAQLRDSSNHQLAVSKLFLIYIKTNSQKMSEMSTKAVVKNSKWFYIHYRLSEIVVQHQVTKIWNALYSLIPGVAYIPGFTISLYFTKTVVCTNQYYTPPIPHKTENKNYACYVGFFCPDVMVHKTTVWNIWIWRSILDDYTVDFMVSFNK